MTFLNKYEFSDLTFLSRKRAFKIHIEHILEILSGNHKKINTISPYFFMLKTVVNNISYCVIIKCAEEHLNLLTTHVLSEFRSSMH